MKNIIILIVIALNLFAKGTTLLEIEFHNNKYMIKKVLKIDKIISKTSNTFIKEKDDLIIELKDISWNSIEKIRITNPKIISNIVHDEYNQNAILYKKDGIFTVRYPSNNEIKFVYIRNDKFEDTLKLQ